MTHQVNIAIHVLTGTIAIVIGIFTIAYNRRIATHRRLGRYFLYLLSIVVVTGFIGFFFFRKDPFLMMLTLIAFYVGYAGFRNIKLREKRSSFWDALVAIVTLSLGLIYLYRLSNSEVYWNISVVVPTVVALALVTIYDLTKYFFLHSYLKTWWLYEHIYKMISAFSALLSAFAGNVLRDFQPYSQIGPSIFCTLLAIYFIASKVIVRKHSQV